MTAIHDVENEQVVLGAALACSQQCAVVLASVAADDFLFDNHKAIYAAIVAACNTGLALESDTIVQLASQTGYSVGDNPYGYVVKLRQAYVANTNIKYHIGKLRLDAVKNRISVQHMPKLLSQVSRPQTAIADISAALDVIQQELHAAADGNSGFVRVGDLGDEYANELARRQGSTLCGTGYSAIDEHLTEGFVPKNISIIGAFSGVGKSTLIVNMMRRQAKMGKTVALYSLEMKRSSVLDLFNSMETGLPINAITRPPLQITEAQIDFLVSVVRNRASLNIFINDNASLSMAQIATEIRRLTAQGHKPDIVYIDLFGKVAEVDTGDNLAQLVQRELKHLRVLARTLDVHFCLATQLNRESQMKSKGKVGRPQIRHIKNSNAYQEEADLVFLLHRAKQYDKGVIDDILEVEIAKQRMGISGVRAYLEYDGEHATVRPTTLVPEDLREPADAAD